MSFQFSLNLYPMNFYGSLMNNVVGRNQCIFSVFFHGDKQRRSEEIETF